MLLGFYDRYGEALAVELSPEMAKAIASLARGIYRVARDSEDFEDVSEVRLARFAFDKIYALNRYKPKGSDQDGFFALPETERLYESSYEPTGVWIDVECNEPTVFWEIYDSQKRQNTPYLGLEQLDAIANNQPLPQE